MPAHNEEECLRKVVEDICVRLEKEKIPAEIVIVNDNSTDSTPGVIDSLSKKYGIVRRVDNTPPSGFGRAIRKGLDNVTGDAVAIVMGDGSDDAGDIVNYYRKLCEGYDCVFGSRFIKGGIVKDYPFIKLFFNRLGNYFIKYLFGVKCNDITNAFKAYRRNVIEAVKPLVSNHFNITVEIPLKAFIRGYSYTVVPISWYGRASGISKYNLREVQRKYDFSILYVWLEKSLLKNEFKGKK